MSGDIGMGVWIRLFAISVLGFFVTQAEAGDGGRGRQGGSVQVLPAAQAVSLRPRAVAPLGTFYPTPYIMVRGNGTSGGGYSPLGVYGDQTMVMYGPISSFRSTTAPVLTYRRGYNGQPTPASGTSFSTPNLPVLTPVVYPTQANNYFGFRVSGEPPWWQNGINWVDQN